MQCHYIHDPDEFQSLNSIRDGGAAAILDLLKPAIYQEWLNRFLPNLAGPCSVTMDMVRMSFNL